jgi:hypothetical protein
MTGTTNDLNQALQSNAGAYGGLANQNLQNYYQNAGAVQGNLINQGLGNTTVADTMAQAPLQTYQNSMLNLTGQQNSQNTGIYTTAAQDSLQAALAAQAAAANKKTTGGGYANQGSPQGGGMQMPGGGGGSYNGGYMSGTGMSPTQIAASQAATNAYNNPDTSGLASMTMGTDPNGGAITNLNQAAAANAANGSYVPQTTAAGGDQNVFEDSSAGDQYNLDADDSDE